MEGATILIHNTFYDYKRYDLARVGRYKYNKKLALATRIAGYTLAEDVVSNVTGEILEQIAKGIYEKINSTQGFQRQIENYLGHAITTTEKSRITCSIGIASAGDVRKEEDINELIRSADEILYKVKTGEKGHYAFL